MDLTKRLRDCANGLGDFKTERGDFGLCDDAADEIERLRTGLVDMSGRIDWASNMFHNSQRWHDEGAPNGSGTLWDWVHAPMKRNLKP